MLGPSARIHDAYVVCCKYVIFHFRIPYTKIAGNNFFQKNDLRTNRTDSPEPPFSMFKLRTTGFLSAVYLSFLTYGGKALLSAAALLYSCACAAAASVGWQQQQWCCSDQGERGLKPVVALLLLGLCSSLSESQLGGLRTRKFKGTWVLILF